MSWKVGQLCQVVYAESKDFFRPKPCPAAGGAFPGTVQGIHKKTKKAEQQRLNICFQDGSVETVKAVEVQKVYPGKTHPHIYYTALEPHDQCAATQAYNTQPGKLKVGDLVLGNFQNGNVYFRGRIARVAVNDRYDIFYDDQDAEAGVPREAITLLQRGAEHPGWLKELVLNQLKSKHGTAGVQGQVVVAEPKQALYVEFSKTDGEKTTKWTERKAYAHVVTALMKQYTPSQMFVWPVAAAKSSTPTKGSTETKSRSSNEAAKPPARRRSKRSATISDKENLGNDVESSPSPRKRRASRRTTAAASSQSAASIVLDDHDDDDWNQPRAHTATLSPPPTRQGRRNTNQTTATTKTRNTQRRKAPARDFDASIQAVLPKLEGINSIHMNIHSHCNTIVKNKSPPPQPEMHDAVAEALQDALQSRDTEFAAQFLTSIPELPPKDCLQDMIPTILYGPRSSDGGVFPDAARLNKIASYLQMVWHKDPHRVVQALPKDYVQLALTQLADRDAYYTLPVDWRMTGTTAAAEHWGTHAPTLQRLGLTQHARATHAEWLAQVLERELNGPSADPTSVVMQGVLRHSRGPKHALEQSMQVYVETAIFLFGQLLPARRHAEDVAAQAGAAEISSLASSAGVFCLVEGQSNRLLRALGRIVSELACLYGRETSETMDAIAPILGMVVQKQLDGQLNSTTVAEEEDTTVAKIKLEVILHLDMKRLLPAYPKLADMMGVAPEFNLIFGE